MAGEIRVRREGPGMAVTVVEGPACRAEVRPEIDTYTAEVFKAGGRRVAFAEGFVSRQAAVAFAVREIGERDAYALSGALA